MCNQSVITQCVINDDDGRGEKRSKGRERRGTDERGRERRRREKKRREKRTRRKERDDYTMCNQCWVLGKVMGVRGMITHCVINGGWLGKGDYTLCNQSVITQCVINQ